MWRRHPSCKDGNRLQSRYFGRLPEGKKQSLKTQIRAELHHLLGQNPDLKLVLTADGEKGIWTFSKSLNPDVEVLDFWHAIEHLKRAANAAFGCVRLTDASVASESLAGRKVATTFTPSRAPDTVRCQVKRR